MDNHTSFIKEINYEGRVIQLKCVHNENIQIYWIEDNNDPLCLTINVSYIPINNHEFLFRKWGIYESKLSFLCEIGYIIILEDEINLVGPCYVTKCELKGYLNL